ncbi:MAG: coenzyme gamma-glutamyl ligase [Chloroflexi bacterium]|nr:coenzyme gamma-glutamyl ligase [Chloroflexota bacterium]
MSPGAVFILPIAGLPEIHAGENLGALLVQALMRTEIGAQPGDILVVTHKIVAKAEGALVDLRTVEPSSFALSFAAAWSKDPRQVEVVLRHTKRIVRMDHGVIISETQHGLICANAGVDQSNIEGEDVVCVLPDDPDRSAQQIAETVREMTGHELGVIVSDTFGRPWREGLTNVAIGVAGIRPLRDYIGMKDAQGRTLKVTALAIADELAGAAELVMGKLDRIPAAIIRGYQVESEAGSSRELLRKPELDMFR